MYDDEYEKPKSWLETLWTYVFWFGGLYLVFLGLDALGFNREAREERARHAELRQLLAEQEKDLIKYLKEVKDPSYKERREREAAEEVRRSLTDPEFQKDFKDLLMEMKLPER
jgi:hypothetical protein